MDEFLGGWRACSPPRSPLSHRESPGELSPAEELAPRWSSLGQGLERRLLPRCGRLGAERAGPAPRHRFPEQGAVLGPAMGASCTCTAGSSGGDGVL